MKTKACVAASACKESNYGIAGYGFFIGCCKTDECNSASGLAPKYITMISAIAVFMALFKLRN